jgi:quinol monooxygenase YgiN
MSKGSCALCGIVVAVAAICGLISTDGQTMKPPPVVRIAELAIDGDQLVAYRLALSGEIATSIRIEPGVLNLYAVSVKDHPSQVRIFELYKDQTAYESHLQTSHFKKYKEATQGMVMSLKLVETEPIMLGAK